MYSFTRPFLPFSTRLRHFPNFIINFFEKHGSLTLSAAVSATLELLQP